MDLAVRSATRQWLAGVEAAAKTAKAEAERVTEEIHVYGQMIVQCSCYTKFAMVFSGDAAS